MNDYIVNSRSIWSAVPRAPLKFFKVINCSDGAAALNDLWYHTEEI